ncbi:HNH endonuclease [Cupriavidus sp. H18C2]|uniref:HNH endonuclease n=1 Tax=Cupriavidus sp. H18C2 TaxID=3241602 RepID=UPI003BF9056D
MPLKSNTPSLLPDNASLTKDAVTGSTVKRNPVWSRDELLLALQLYLTHRSAPPSKDSPEVAALSLTLNKMGATLGLGHDGSYRNRNGVYMKMMNFRRFDPEYTKNGKVGLARGNKDEEIVWARYAGNPLELSLVCGAIIQAIDDPLTGAGLGPEEPEVAEAEEGRILTRVHRVRERSRALVLAAKAAARKKYGRLCCEACGFDFEAEYGNRGANIIDVHHTRPLHSLAEGGITRLDELALLCANCHRVVHASRPWLSVEELAEIIKSERR